LLNDLKMNKEQFVILYYPFAKKAEQIKGVPVLFALAQSALESGWGKHTPNNMLFGIKKGSGRNYGGWSGESQLITTTEYSSSSTKNYPVILPGYPIRSSSGKWKYRIKDFFRAYGSPLGSLLDWAGLLTGNARYRKALRYKKEPYQFAKEVIRGGYATDPNYLSKVSGIMQQVEQIIEKYKLKEKNKSKKNWVKVTLLLGIAIGIGILTYTSLSENEIEWMQ